MCVDSNVRCVRVVYSGDHMWMMCVKMLGVCKNVRCVEDVSELCVPLSLCSRSSHKHTHTKHMTSTHIPHLIPHTHLTFYTTHTQLLRPVVGWLVEVLALRATEYVGSYIDICVIISI